MKLTINNEGANQEMIQAKARANGTFTKRSFHHDKGESMNPMKAMIPPLMRRLCFICFCSVSFVMVTDWKSQAASLGLVFRAPPLQQFLPVLIQLDCGAVAGQIIRVNVNRESRDMANASCAVNV